MSQRLQVLLEDNEYKALKNACENENVTMAEFVRQSIRSLIKKKRPLSQSEKLSKVLKYASYGGPTGDIKDLLEDINKGKNS